MGKTRSHKRDSAAPEPRMLELREAAGLALERGDMRNRLRKSESMGTHFARQSKSTRR